MGKQLVMKEAASICAALTVVLVLTLMLSSGAVYCPHAYANPGEGDLSAGEPLFVQASESEPNNAFSSASSIKMDEKVNATLYYKSGSGTVSGKDTDYYKVSVPNTGRVSVILRNEKYYVNGGLWASITVELYNSHYERITGRDWANTNVTRSTEISYSLQPGTYYVKIYPDSLMSTPPANHPYSLTVAYSQGMHRLYNPYTGEHFYTASAPEKNDLEKVGWRYEGIGWYAPRESSDPVYRLYNPYAGDHHYTTSTKERDHLVSVGWRDEGIGWYSDSEHRTELYRQYNPYARTGCHNYTTSREERNQLVRVGWRSEGTAWYGL